MAKWAKVKYNELVKLKKDLDKLQQANLIKFYENMLKQLAEKLLAKAVSHTPADSTDLRESWAIGSVHYTNGSYEVEVYNDSIYAYSVEWGYLAADKKTLLPGRFMLRISEEELKGEADKIVEDKLIKFFKGAFHDS
jgi:hypothetical protein